MNKNTLSVKFTSLMVGLVILLTMAFVGITLSGETKGKPWPAVPDTYKKLKNPVVSNDATIKEGKEIYLKNCKSCHGLKGKGDGPKAENIDISCGDFTTAAYSKETDGELFWKTTEGRKPMPSFKVKLNDEERWKSILYTRTLLGK